MKKKVLIILSLVVIAGAGFTWWRFKNRVAEGPGFSQVRVTKGPLSIKILSTGIIQPENRLEIKPPISGRIEKVMVAEGDKVRKGQVMVVMSSSERAALLDAASAKGPDELKRWQDFYQAAPILAPLRGTVILRNVEPGQTVTSQDTLLVMSDRLTVKAQVDETDIAKIALKMKAQIELDAYPDKSIPARVDQIAYEAKTVNNVTTYVVDVLPERTPPFMRSGMTANVTFLLNSKDNVLQVPSGAVLTKNSRTYVRVPTPQKPEVPQEKNIEIGLTDGKSVEVISGINEGDIVLVPQYSVDKTGGKTQQNPMTPFSGRHPR